MLERELESVPAGERPIAVVASAGTASTGAIDALDELADVCGAHGVWLHVDAAYGGAAVLTDRYRAALAGLARADSVALDPHKWLYVPVDCGCALVRRGDELRDVFSLIPPYLRQTGDEQVGTFAEYGFEQTRPFRALRVWAALAATGRDGYRRLIDNDLDHAERLAERVHDHPELELESVRLSIVCFRYRSDGANDALQAEIARRIQLSGEAFVTTTAVNGRTALRACFLNPLTSAADVDALVELVARAGDELRSARRG